ncbi:hypothetical protein [Streptomyces sp. ISL-94]|uniref:hypothetical protein n=1 Tax=Streptomyces sp. ISL-94 TaxID=2819190 RepID=UPI001BE89DAC|nr:hypothetical protein [Streptomyces sp. ISL-94]MBT2477674.1 hypothetical protein [Streptomyces sp. ISL-94]
MTNDPYRIRCDGLLAKAADGPRAMLVALHDQPFLAGLGGDGACGVKGSVDGAAVPARLAVEAGDADAVEGRVCHSPSDLLWCGHSQIMDRWDGHNCYIV